MDIARAPESVGFGGAKSAVSEEGRDLCNDGVGVRQAASGSGGSDGARAAQANEESLLLRYGQLPLWAQHAACSVEGWKIQQRRYGKGYAEIQRQVDERAGWTPERLADFRDNRIAAFVRHAARTCPWYHDEMMRLRIDAEEICGLNDLANLPIITKLDVQSQTDRFVSTACSNYKTVMVHTSGTTGGALRFPATVDATREQWATWWRYRKQHGIAPNTWCGYFGGRSIVPVRQSEPPYWRYNWPGRQLMFSSYHMRPNAMKAYVAKLRMSRPPWLHGYPSMLALLASYIQESGEELGYRVRWVTTGAESLLPQQAEAISCAFGTFPRQSYGMAEAVANFSECECGRLHIDEDLAAVEFVPLSDGSAFRVIGTNLSNPAMPLIRYDTGDVVQSVGEACPCGRPGRFVDRVDGRKEDYVTLRDGTRIGRMDHVFKDMIRVREAQIYQKEPGAIEVRIVRGTGFGPEDEQALLKSFHLRLGLEVSITLEYHDRLPRTASGKLRFVISEIPSAEIERLKQ